MSISPLFEFMAYLLIVAIAFTASDYVPDPTQRVIGSAANFDHLVISARTEAGKHDGETLGYAVQNGVTVVTTYAGLPLGGSTKTVLNIARLEAILKVNGATSGALLIDPDGTVRPQNGWNAWTILVAVPAACTTSVTVQSIDLPNLALSSPSCSATE